MDSESFRGHWKYIKQNIDLPKFEKELKKTGVVEESEIDHLGKIRRSRAFNELFCIAYKKRKQLQSIDLQTILESNSRCIASKLQTPILKPKWILDAEITFYESKLEAIRPIFVSTFKRLNKEEDLLDILDEFIEGFVFDFLTLGEITSCFTDLYENAINCFLDNILHNISLGSYQCLIESLTVLAEKKKRNFKQILSNLKI